MTPCEALAARAAAAVDPERAVALARALVQRRSVFEPERGCAEAEAARFLAATLRESGFSVTLEEVAPGRPNVIADWSGSRFDPKRHKTLLFGGHTDVVTEGDAAAWKHPPSRGCSRGGASTAAARAT